MTAPYPIKVLSPTEQTRYLASLQQSRPAETGGVCFSLGVDYFGGPAGIAVAEAGAIAPGRGKIHAVRVRPEFRRRGIGSTLLREAQDRLAGLGCSQIEVSYLPAAEDTVEPWLRHCGWNAPHGFAIYRTDYALLSQAPWMQLRAWPKEFETFPWISLPSADRADIARRQEACPWYLESLSPFLAEHKIDPTVSLGLRYRGEVVGWCISYPVGRRILHCSKLFVRKDLQTTARAIMLLAEAFHRTPESGIDQFAFDVALDNPRMLRFVERRLKPYVRASALLKRSVRFYGKEAADGQIA